MRPNHIIFILVTGVVGIGAFVYSTVSPVENSATPIVEETASAVAATEKQTTRYIIPVLSESTLLDAMDAYAANSDFIFSGRVFPGLGFFVETIGGIENADGFYWTLFINNVLSEQGASSLMVRPGDVVEWRYQKGVRI